MLSAAFVLDPQAFPDVYAPVLDRIRSQADIVYGPAAHPAPTQADVLCTSWGAPVLDRALLEAMPRLKLVLYAAGSVRKIVTPEFWDRGIPLVSAYTANAVPVADFTYAQIVYALKGGWRYVLNARATRSPLPRTPQPGLYGSRVGLVSLGAIGRLVADRLRALRLEVIAYDPSAGYEGVRMAGLDEVFATSDVVSVHTPLLPETRGLVGRSLLASMKPGATLLNTARGAVLDQIALLEVLAERPDLFAVLDVTDPEPPVPGSPLFTLPNVVVTPHIAGSLGAERGLLGELVAAELERFATGQPLRHALTREAAARLA